MFEMNSTQGYTQEELDEMNIELAREMHDHNIETEEDDPDLYKYLCEQICNRHS